MPRRRLTPGLNDGTSDADARSKSRSAQNRRPGIAHAPPRPTAQRAPIHATKGTIVEIPKDKILDLLREQGKSDQVEQAEKPDQVDPERHSGLLEKFGLEPQDVLSKLGGGIPGL